MTHKQRFITALTRGIPDRVPTFELEFQLEHEMFGPTFDYSRIAAEAMASCSHAERDRTLHELAEHFVDIYLNKLEYDSIPVNGFYSPKRQEDIMDFIRILRKLVGDTACLHHHGDGTFALPDGNEMYTFSYRLADDYEGVITSAEQMCQAAIERNKVLAEAGIDVFILCSDYCYNSGPFLSPAMFSDLITPYLARIITAIRETGCYAIKHTDGNIMPVIDQLVEANPHAIHSLDPMAGVDIKVVKSLYGDKVALCGNVNCALMQTGTDEEMIESAEYCLTHGKPGGGYVYCTSNVPFRGLPAERYRLILDVFKNNRDY